MSSPPLAPTPENLSRRPFSFYPPILNIEHNEWEFREATWSEVLVANTRTAEEVWMPRRLLDAVSRVDEPVMIVGLLKEVEYKAGTVWPTEKRVLPMPAPVMAPTLVASTTPAQPHRAPSGLKAARSAESRLGLLIAGVMGGALVVVVLAVAALRQAPYNPRVVFTTRDQAFLELNSRDDYFSVVRKLGQPAEDRWRSEQGELQYRLLWYPQRSFYAILMGTDRKDARYIGAVDKQWHVAHYVELSRGHTTAAMMRSIPKF